MPQWHVGNCNRSAQCGMHVTLARAEIRKSSHSELLVHISLIAVTGSLQVAHTG
jgi:hypothetical protein